MTRITQMWRDGAPNVTEVDEQEVAKQNVFAKILEGLARS